VDAALAARACGCGSVRDLPLALIRLALAKAPAAIAHPDAPAPRVEPKAPEPAPLARFAETVRALARQQPTGPFRGRVAIAQVYDAGVAAGYSLGSLTEFKARLAEAARADLLPLERYDLAGPMDTALKERSRLPFGRDERHFIVQDAR
jgi:hypothetical protein